MANRIVLWEVELFEVAVITLLILAVQRLDPSALGRYRSAIRRIAKYRCSCVAFVGLLGFGASAALTAGLGMPVPCVHDEFSYLLAADTFAHGRLSNPTPPCWEHFEAIHVNLTPTYHSMYPPGQGLALAAGQVLMGYPIVGVWLSIGLACAAVCWMLQAWCPPYWALCGGLLAVFRFVFMRHPWPWPLQIGYWSQSYWGGAVALFAAALLFGALRRFVRRGFRRDTALFGIGLALLANSRPFEGLFASIPASGLILPALWRNRLSEKRQLVTTVACLAAILAVTSACMAYYNVRTTGSVLLRPYELSSRLHDATPVTLLQALAPEPDYRHAHHRNYYVNWARPEFQAQRTPAGYLKRLTQKAIESWSYYFGALLTLPVIALPWAAGGRWQRLAIVTCGVVLIALAFMPWLQVHYLSPIAPLLVYLEVRCLRVLWFSRCPGRLLWRSLAAAIPPALFIAMPVSAVLWADGARHDEWCHKREEIARQLRDVGGQHLILVSGNRSAHVEWAYNGADLKSGPVIWAHDLSPNANACLIEQYPGRIVWSLQTSKQPLELRHFEVTAMSDDDGESDPELTAAGRVVWQETE